MTEFNFIYNTDQFDDFIKSKIVEVRVLSILIPIADHLLKNIILKINH